MPDEIRFPQEFQFKKWNVIVYLLIFLTITFGGKFIYLITDYYWFQEIGFGSFFMKSLLTQMMLGMGAFAVVWLILYLNYHIAKRACRTPFVVIEPDATVTAPLPIPQLAELKTLLQVILFILTILIAFITANRASNHWETFLKFSNGVPFGAVDPLFGRDIGFYLFHLPFYRVLYNIFITTCLSSMVVALGIYLLNGRIYLSGNKIQIAENAKKHLLILSSLLCLALFFYFQLKMYDLLSTQRAIAPGPGYADIHAYLPGLKVMRWISLISALLFAASLKFQRAKIALGTVILLAGSTVLVRIYAETIQKFEVAPNEIEKETPYLKRAIEHTREAYGLTKIQELEFDPQLNLTAEALKKNDLTIKNIRLWEHRPLLTSYGQLQEIRTYYDFIDADNDRYSVNGEYRQIMVSARELSPESLPSRNWINEHLTYTHGYGICLGPVNRISPEGLPEFFIKDIPPVPNTNLHVTRPEIYFGESRANYAIVNTKSKEFNYPAGEENVYTEYGGTGGVKVKNFLRKMLFSLRFGELKILLSGDITPESRFLYYRQIHERLSKSAPFILFDGDPYIVISESGRLLWIVDGYTVTDRYPYSEKTVGINYIRNAVKATVDAYDGTIRLYISDPNDPIIRTYAQIFPELFRTLDEMPEDLRRHIRYPQTLMNIQARIYAIYHMTEPQVFYNKEDLWKIPLRTIAGGSEPMEPYFTIMKLAGLAANEPEMERGEMNNLRHGTLQTGDKEEFILMVPFTPSKKENMISWMAARCDPPNYGKLLVYNFPKQKLVYGPQQIESRIDQEAEISKQLTLWDQGGSRVIRGSLLVIPVDQSLLYIQPLYLEASGGGLPELKRIIVAYGNSIVMEENLELSLMKIFGGKVSPATGKASSQPQTENSRELKSLVHQIKVRFENAQRASRQGDWAAYGEDMKMVEKLLKTLSESQ